MTVSPRDLATEELHGVGVADRIEALTQGAFRVSPGSLFPALHRLEADGWLESSWGRSETNRKAKLYRLTRSGRRHLEREAEAWRHVVDVMSAALTTP